MARARDALGVDAARIRGELVIEAEGTFSGVPMRAVLRASASGRAVDAVRCPLGQVLGFDGERGWSVDLTGLPGPLDLEDLATLRLHAAVRTGRWTLPGSGVVPVRLEARGGLDVLTVRMGSGPTEAHLHLDRERHLPVELEVPAGGEGTTRYLDYRPGPWGLLAHHTVSRAGWLEDEAKTIAVRTSDAEDPHAYAAIEAAPRDVRFLPGVDPAVPLSASRRGRLPLVRPRIGGRDLGWFLVDTGAASLAIDAKLAEELGWSALGRTWVTTVDGGTGAAHRFGGPLELGPLVMERPTWLELDLAPVTELLGTRVAGILGYDLFARAVVRFAPANGQLELRAPDDPWTPPAPWQPLRFEQRVPMVRCATVHGAGLFGLDTGGGIDVLLYPWTVSAWALPPARARAAQAHGLTGAQGISVRRTPWLELGGERFERVSLGVAGQRGVAAGSGKLGLVGWRIARGLDLTLDYARARWAAVRGPR